MKTILVPTDFSDTARNAAGYAYHLSGYFDMAVKLVHVFLPTPSTDYEPVTEPFLKAEQVNREKLEKLASSLLATAENKEQDKQPVCWDLLFGFPAEEVIKYSKKEDCTFIVMGATGESGAFEKLFGKVSVHVASHARCPVLLVPDDSAFTPYQNILYTTNDPQLDAKMLVMVQHFAEKFGSAIHLLHVGEEDEYYPAFEMKKLLHSRNANLQITEALVREESVVTGIAKYVEEKDIDLVIMATRHRNFWQGILHRSVTRKMAFGSDVPLLLFHEQDRKVL